MDKREVKRWQDNCSASKLLQNKPVAYLEVGSVLDWSTLVEPGDLRQRLSGHDHLEDGLSALGHVQATDGLQEPRRLHLLGQLQTGLRRRRWTGKQVSEYRVQFNKENNEQPARLTALNPGQPGWISKPEIYNLYSTFGITITITVIPIPP